MKNCILPLLVLFLLFSLPLASSGASAPARNSAPVETSVLSKKELRKQKRAQKMAKFIQKRMDKRMTKLEKQRKGQGFGDLDRNLQLAILFGVAALALIILSSIISFLSVLSAIAWVAGLIFLILWLVENV